ncbi:hypothetical protein CC85DRAFT_125494 [Cutaneotrichosporon oleaginosum]|uniref:Uncharacterized protein n=1 Tax=Cutaneotrichosporon oleaginosum TaxID=879819 RepID=A0A0J0XJH7_9TREE|nr:uncharacterized protein CC85DRAFT_125494 [Cutaneotrichosporon oleaginosum]KLT41206.1 hypothetical protein CC85DRAFT_125494 [Cutaneotrichosporon oleaginosum]
MRPLNALKPQLMFSCQLIKGAEGCRGAEGLGGFCYTRCVAARTSFAATQPRSGAGRLATLSRVCSLSMPSSTCNTAALPPNSGHSTTIHHPLTATPPPSTHQASLFRPTRISGHHLPPTHSFFTHNGRQPRSLKSYHAGAQAPATRREQPPPPRRALPPTHYGFTCQPQVSHRTLLR